MQYPLLAMLPLTKIRKDRDRSRGNEALVTTNLPRCVHRRRIGGVGGCLRSAGQWKTTIAGIIATGNVTTCQDAGRVSYIEVMAQLARGVYLYRGKLRYGVMSIPNSAAGDRLYGVVWRWSGRIADKNCISIVTG